jgi:hypothetical protein
MTDADLELRRGATKLLRRHDNDVGKALVEFCHWLFAAPPEVFSAFLRASPGDGNNGIEGDAKPYLEKLSQTMPRVV